MRGEQLPNGFGAAELAFSDALIRWQGVLATAAAESLPNLLPQAIGELDEAWPHYGEHCSFHGNAVYPLIEDEGTSVTVQAGEYTGEGFSQGMAAHDFNESGRPRLYHMFLVDRRVQSSHPIIRIEQQLYVFLDTTGVIVPTMEIERALTPEHQPPQVLSEVQLERVYDSIDAASQELIHIYRSTAFRRLSVKRQRAIIDKFMTDCERTFNLREADLIMEADYCCRASIQGDEVRYDFLPIRDNVVKGTFLGFGTLERETLATRAIRRDADLVQRDAGLCLIVEVKEASDPTPLRQTDVVLVPLSGQDPDVHFFQAVNAELFDDEPPTEPNGPDGLVSV